MKPRQVRRSQRAKPDWQERANNMLPSTPSLALYADQDILVVNKPADLPTLVDGYRPEAPYLLGLLKAEYGELWVVHRLDRQTSGVIVFARSAAAHRTLNIQFEKRKVEKVYHALVQGSPAWEAKNVNLPLRANGDRRHRSTVDAIRGKPCSTELRLLERYADHALLEAIPHTGRTHQIRAHLAALGHPIVGDHLYGGKSLEGLTRLGLHASRLKFCHPVSGVEVEFRAPMPDDLTHALKTLRQENLSPPVEDDTLLS